MVYNEREPWQALLIFSGGERHTLSFDDEATARDFWRQWCAFTCGKGPRHAQANFDPLFGGDGWAIDMRRVDAVFLRPTPTSPTFKVCLPCYAMMALAAVGFGWLVSLLVNLLR